MKCRNVITLVRDLVRSKYVRNLEVAMAPHAPLARLDLADHQLEAMDKKGEVRRVRKYVKRKT